MTNKTNMNHSIKSVQSKLVAILICGIMVLASCSNNDNSTPPDTTALTMWQAGRTVSAEAGFEWGGDWTTCKDYQHFEVIEDF